MGTMPPGETASTPKPAQGRRLALLWLVLLVVDVVHAWVSERWLSWGHAASVLLIVSGLLIALSLHQHEQGRPYALAGKAGLATVLLAAGAMVIDILMTTGYLGR